MSNQQLLLGTGKAIERTYVDEVFSSTPYTGQYSTLTISNGLDNLTDGGMLWVKSREHARKHLLYTTEHLDSGSSTSTQKVLKTNETDALEDYGGNATVTFKTDGWSVLNGDGDINQGGFGDYMSWNFKKNEGFFDVVKYTGNGSSSRDIPHNLKSKPGMIWIKKTSGTSEWRIWHTFREDVQHRMSTDGVSSSSGYFGSTFNDTHFSVENNSEVNDNGQEYIAYVWAGGLSNSNSAKACDFNGNTYLRTDTASTDFDFGTGDFTVEYWIKPVGSMQNKGIFQISDFQGNHGGSSNYSSSLNMHTYDTYVGSSFGNAPALQHMEWTHVAMVRSSGVGRIYYNGAEVHKANNTTDYDLRHIMLASYWSNSYNNECQLSNFRVVKGTAVYTDSFKVPTEPLANITGTIFLGCNGSTSTSPTVTPVTLLAQGTVGTTSQGIPFNDIKGHIFGTNGEEEIIKCGSYIGNGSDTIDIKVHLGWEPQWLLVKNTSTSGSNNWQLVDQAAMWPSKDLNSNNYWSTIRPNVNQAENNTTVTGVYLDSDGFTVGKSYGNFNTSGETHMYVAIRRTDGWVGKPVTTPNLVFDVKTQTNTNPHYQCNFPVDAYWHVDPTSGNGWQAKCALLARKMGADYHNLSETDAGGDTTWHKWDVQTGAGNGTATGSSYLNYQAWLFKRHAGMDYISYVGTSASLGQAIPHGLGGPVEMVWIKPIEDGGTEWKCYTAFRGITNVLRPNNALAEETNQTNFKAFDRTNAMPDRHLYVRGGTNYNNKIHNALLFRSVDGICKCGGYTGNGSASGPTITLGFQPKMLIIKNANSTASWCLLDSLRGLNTSTQKIKPLDDEAAQGSGSNWVTTTSTTFQPVTTDVKFNANGDNYIYYAHA